LTNLGAITEQQHYESRYISINHATNGKRETQASERIAQKTVASHENKTSSSRIRAQITITAGSNRLHQRSSTNAEWQY
jgi:hypothetical protein